MYNSGDSNSLVQIHNSTSSDIHHLAQDLRSAVRLLEKAKLLGHELM